MTTFNSPTSEIEVIRPSYFAALGSPSCSKWGKSEIEWIALAYVQAMANNGDKWEPLTRQQTVALLTEEQKHYVHGMLDGWDVGNRWFEAVRDQIKDAEGAFGVGGLSWRRK